jgi:FkbM family methyltransferase
MRARDHGPRTTYGVYYPHGSKFDLRHIGMHNGDDKAYYLRRKFNVIAIEANPTLVAAAAKRFDAEIKTGQLKILNIGIAAEEGEFPFWVSEKVSQWSSFDRGLASRDGSPHHEVRVTCKRLRTVLNEFGVPYYLKIIQGNDTLCITTSRPKSPAAIHFD